MAVVCNPRPRPQWPGQYFLDIVSDHLDWRVAVEGRKRCEGTALLDGAVSVVLFGSGGEARKRNVREFVSRVDGHHAPAHG